MIKTDSSLEANLWKIYLFKFFINLHFCGGILIPFLTEWGGINFAQIMFLQSWFMLWIFILELPTGTVADFWGRKYSLMLGCLANIIAVIVYASFPSFYIFLLGEFLWALSIAFLPGADEAFIYDTLKKIGRLSESKKIFGRMESADLIGIMVGAPLGSFIAKYLGLRAPLFLMVIPFFISFIIALTFKEPVVINKTSETKRYLNILKEGLKFFSKNRILKILALDMIVIESIAYFIIWLYQPMLRKGGVDIVYFGVIHALFVFSQILILNNYETLEKLLGSKKSLIFFSAIITGIMFIIGGLTNFFPLILLVILIGGGFGLARKPLFVSYINKYVSSSKRATVLSSVSMFRRFTLAIVNPFVGLLVDWSLDYTLIILGVVAVIFSFFSKVEESYLMD